MHSLDRCTVATTAASAAFVPPSILTLCPRCRCLPCACLPARPPLVPQSYLPVASGYFSSERSFAQLRLPDGHRSLVGFGREPTTLLLVSATGGFYKASFDPDKGGTFEAHAYVQWMEEEGQQR